LAEAPLKITNPMIDLTTIEIAGLLAVALLLAMAFALLLR
jgi:hypothetical protein